jgi:short subunit dehydrogenase-like uncharacterized protein
LKLLDLQLLIYTYILCTSLYRQTAKFIAESGVALALDTAALPPMYGILTPSTALGTVLLERLRAKGVDFYIGEHKA